MHLVPLGCSSGRTKAVRRTKLILHFQRRKKSRTFTINHASFLTFKLSVAVTSDVKIWPAAYHLSNTYCYCKMIRCYNPVADKMPQKIYFSCFLRTNRFSWNLASLLSYSFPWKPCSTWGFLLSFFRFRAIIISKGSADELPPLTFSYVKKEQIHVPNAMFIVLIRSFLAGLELNLDRHMLLLTILRFLKENVCFVEVYKKMKAL